MTLSALTPADREVVRCLMAASLDLIDDFEYPSRFGLEPAEMRALLASWPDIDDTLDHSNACLAVNNAMNDLLHGLGISESQATSIAGVSRTEIARIYRKWCLARGWKSTGAR